MRFRDLIKPSPRSEPPAGVAPAADSDAVAGVLGAADEAARAAAAARLAGLIDAGSVDFAALRAAAGHSDVVLTVAALCKNPDILAAAMAGIDDPQRLATLAHEGPSTRLRQLAAQRIDDPDMLRLLLKQVRDKDKNVFKIVKQKCDALRAEEQRIVQLDSDVEAACASLERLGTRFYDPLYEASLRQFEAQWHDLEAHAAPPVAARATRAIERCRDVVSAHARLVEERAAEAEAVAAARAARQSAAAEAEDAARRRDAAAAEATAQAAAAQAAEDRARAERAAAAKHDLRQVHGLLGKATAAIRDGDTGRAAALQRAVADKLSSMPAVPPHLAAQVGKLEATLEDFKEWKEFAVAPKRAELIADMQALIGSTEDPQRLAERIRQLRDDWKTTSKGIVSESTADWERFNAAATAAYLPCRAYFEAQSQQRRANLQQRRAVLERLRAFAASQADDATDWRAVATALREAPREFWRYSPVDRAAGATLQADFDAVIGDLRGRFEAWQTGNVAGKTSLIERARALVGKEGNREAVESVKRLQQQWKELGPAPREQEQSLWNEFRTHCDAVFAERQTVQNSHMAELAARKMQAEELCSAAERAASLTGAAIFEEAKKIPGWQAAFEAVGELPRDASRRINERFARAVKACQAAVLTQRARDKQASLDHLFEAARRIHAYGWAVAHATAERDLLQQDAEAFIAGIEHWPKGAPQALKEAWVRAHAATVGDLAAAETALRVLCIRRELLHDRPTPPADQPLRREFQVQRLLHSMGQGAGANSDDDDSLTLEWFRSAPADPALYPALCTRFRAG